MIYEDYKRNHVVLPGRENALEMFLKQDYKGMRHKWKNGFNSHSEDALTWSCFDVIANFQLKKKVSVLNEIFEDAYQNNEKLVLDEGKYENGQIEIHIGKQYTGLSSMESTEVDASIELPEKLVFFEAKLYSTVSMASPPDKPHDQIARKLRIGLDSPLHDRREFFFIFLDIAPVEKLTKRMSKEDALSPLRGGFHEKSKSAWLFNYYKHGRNNSLKPLTNALKGIDIPPVESISENMGWLTWSDLFKSVLRGTISQ
jgi:hypothetical protein